MNKQSFIEKYSKLYWFGRQRSGFSKSQLFRAQLMAQAGLKVLIIKQGKQYFMKPDGSLEEVKNKDYYGKE